MCSKAHGRPPGNVFEKNQVKSYYKSYRRIAPICSTPGGRHGPAEIDRFARLREQGYLGWKIAVGAKEVPYGLFLGELVNFIILALALYLFIVKFLGFVMKAKQAPATPQAPSRQEALLAEIRDLLKAR